MHVCLLTGVLQCKGACCPEPGDCIHVRTDELSVLTCDNE